MTAKAASCPSDELLANYGLGKLDQAGIETIHQHLETCADCRQVVAGLSGDSFVRQLRHAREQPPITPAAPKRNQTFSPGDSIPNQVHSSDTRLPASGKPEPAGKQVNQTSPSKSVANVPSELANHPDYEIIKELGHGGMGVVYLARNRMMDRLEVLKVVGRALLDRPGALERFQQEIRSAARLSHPNIVGAYTVLRPGDLLVFCMEYIDGQDLSQVVKQRGALPVTNATFYAQQAALGLQHAHEKGMVHRDIKPNNLMLAIVNKKHVVKILDFGLAKATSEKGSDAGLTKSGQMLGTPDYIAPEQTLDAQKADIRADIYSLGCTLYFLLSGRPPFNGNSLFEILRAHHDTSADPLNLVRPEVPAELAAVVSKMMAKDPAHRYQTPMEVAKALNPFFKAGGQAAGRPEMSLPPSASILPQPATPIAAAQPIAQAIPIIMPATPLPVAQPISLAPASPLASLENLAAPSPSRPRKQSPPKRRPPVVPIAVGLLLFGLIAAGVIFKFRTTDGVVAIEVNEPNPEVFVDGNHASVSWDSGGTKAEITLPPGTRKIELRKDGFKVTGETVKLESGGRCVLAATLEPLPPSPVSGGGAGVRAPLATTAATPSPSSVHEPPSTIKGERSASTVTPNVTSSYQWPPGTPPPAIAPFDARQARAHQEAWAKHLGVPIEQTNSIGMKLVLIPPGEFTMGSTEQQIDAAFATLLKDAPKTTVPRDRMFKGESPAHEVILTSAFQLGQTEVTVGQFTKFVDATKHVTDAEKFGYGDSSEGALPRNEQKTWRAPGYAVTDEMPVAQVSWNDAVAFCNWLSIQENHDPSYAQDAMSNWTVQNGRSGYRLPAEAQWEYACRAGTSTQYSFGDDPTKLDAYGWFAKNFANGARAVGLKRANAFGLFDMHGNVGEWCQDVFAEDSYSHARFIDPLGPASSSPRVFRGGNMAGGMHWSRSATRLFQEPVFRFRTLGFRVLRPIGNVPPGDTANLGQPLSASASAPAAALKMDSAHRWPPGTPPPAIAPFDAAQARAHQEAWAKHLGVPVEQTNSIGMKLVLVPPGKFMMGSTPESAAVRERLRTELKLKTNSSLLKEPPKESPAHDVTITKSTYFGATEVTIADFRRFVDATKYVTEGEQGDGGSGVEFVNHKGWHHDKAITWQSPGYVINGALACSEDLPVAVVTWNDAVAFCNWLSAKESLPPCYERDRANHWTLIAATGGYRLPTDAEWEFAFRAGTTTEFADGDDLETLKAYEWYWPLVFGTTKAAGSKKPNGFGLHDMGGNVREWCNDWFDVEYYSKSPPKDPLGPDFGTQKVVRGGCFYFGAYECRPAFRFYLPPQTRTFDGGFRVVWSEVTKSKRDPAVPQPVGQGLP